MDHRAPVLLSPVPPPAGHPNLRQLLELLAEVLDASWLEVDLSLHGERRPVRYCVGTRSPGSRRMLLERRGVFRAEVRHDGASPGPAVERVLAFAFERTLSEFLLELQAQLITRALDATEAAVLLFDERGEIVYANPRAEDLLVRQTMGGLQVEIGQGREVPLLSHLTRLAVRLGSRAGDRLTGQHILAEGTRVVWELVVLEPAVPDGPGAALAIVRLLCSGAGDDEGTALAGFSLTRREREVVRHLLCGSSTREIAARMGISPHTVRDHLKHVFRKTGARSRGELVALAEGQQPRPGRRGRGEGTDAVSACRPDPGPR